MAQSAPHDPQTGIADALGQLSQETRVLVRQELDDARDELLQRPKGLLPAAALLGIAGGLALASAASSYRLVLRILEKLSSPGAAAFLATGGFGAGALVAWRGGRRLLGEAPLPVPAGSVAETGRDVRETAARTRAEVSRRAG